MIKCKDAIDISVGCGKDICCCECDEKNTCQDVCDYVANGTDDGCKCKIQEDDLPAEFETAGGDLIQKITNICVQKAKLDEQEKEMRKALQEAMEHYGVKKFENDKVSFTYKAPSTRTSIDSTKLKKEHPEIAEKYSKVSNVSASVVIKVK